MGDLIQMRDFKTREERVAARKAKRTAAMDDLIAMSADWIGVTPSEILSVDLTAFEPGHPVEIGQMPPVQPYFAPEKDPA